jgi:hypothetical protein
MVLSAGDLSFFTGGVLLLWLPADCIVSGDGSAIEMRGCDDGGITESEGLSYSNSAFLLPSIVFLSTDFADFHRFLKRFHHLFDPRKIVENISGA